MILSHSRRFIFVHLHKTAGESITQALAPHLSANDIRFSASRWLRPFNEYYKAKYKLRKHSSASSLKSLLGEDIWDSYYKFSFVRNPIDRIRSLRSYYERIARERDAHPVRSRVGTLLGLTGDPESWPGMQAYRETQSFSEFIRRPKLVDMENGARQQFDLLTDDNGCLLVDFVGRFETLQDDFLTVARTIGVEGATLGWSNRSQHPAAVTDISNDDRDYLMRLYRKDFEAFYSPPG